MAAFPHSSMPDLLLVQVYDSWGILRAIAFPDPLPGT
jgi:hypothetical protein